MFQILERMLRNLKFQSDLRDAPFSIVNWSSNASLAKLFVDGETNVRALVGVRVRECVM